MTDFTEGQIEWAARLLCAVFGINPDAQDYKKKRAWQERSTLEEARRLLAELERQGVKVTMRPENDEIVGPTPVTRWHDAAPICPEAE